MRDALSSLAALWNLLALFLSLGVLLWFLYWFVLRRLIRAKKIASARERRMLKEAAERDARERTR
jgi:F0F1-type ATP synthase membrane subunit b/b'